MAEIISLAERKRALEEKKKKSAQGQEEQPKVENYDFEDIKTQNETRKKKMEAERLKANEQVKRSYKLKPNK